MYTRDSDGVHTARMLYQVAPLPTGGDPLSIAITLQNDQRTRSKRVAAYYDTGAPLSVISPAMCRQLHITPEHGNGDSPETITFSGFTPGNLEATHTAIVTVRPLIIGELSCLANRVLSGYVNDNAIRPHDFFPGIIDGS
jgi:hypothetical protein